MNCGKNTSHHGRMMLLQLCCHNFLWYWHHGVLEQCCNLLISCRVNTAWIGFRSAAWNTSTYPFA